MFQCLATVLAFDHRSCVACQQMARARVDSVRIRARLLRDERKKKKAATGAKNTLAGKLPWGVGAIARGTTYSATLLDSRYT